MAVTVGALGCSGESTGGSKSTAVPPGIDAGAAGGADAGGPLGGGGSGGVGGSGATPDPSLATDPDAIANALSYEAQAWEERAEIRDHLVTMWTTGLVDDDEARANGGYSSGYGLAAYHSLDELVALSYLMEVTGDADHRLEYADIAFDITDEHLLPALVEGRGTEGCTGDPDAVYMSECAPGYFRYLDATHGATAIGFVMNAMWEHPLLHAQYEEAMARWAQALVPIVERHWVGVTSTGWNESPHMHAKIAGAVLAVGKVLGESRYTDAFGSLTEKIVASSEDSNPYAGWVGSDIGHANISIAVMHLRYREQSRGTYGMQVEPAHLESNGDMYDTALANFTSSGDYSGDKVASFGVTVRHSAEMGARVSASYAFPAPGSWSYGQQLETVASVAMGHMTRLTP